MVVPEQASSATKTRALGNGSFGRGRGGDGTEWDEPQDPRGGWRLRRGGGEVIYPFTGYAQGRTAHANSVSLDKRRGAVGG